VKLQTPLLPGFLNPARCIVQDSSSFILELSGAKRKSYPDVIEDMNSDFILDAQDLNNYALLISVQATKNDIFIDERWDNAKFEKALYS